MPPSLKTGRIEIKILDNLITYQNISTYFSYGNIAVVDHCFPILGPSRGGTMLAITG